MGSEYLAALKRVDVDAEEAKIEEAPMIYKGIERFVEIQPSCEKGGGLRDYGICLLVFEESFFLMSSFNSCRATKDHMYQGG